jgi:hypothetical protein
MAIQGRVQPMKLLAIIVACALNFGNKLKRKRIKMLVDLFPEYV